MMKDSERKKLNKCRKKNKNELHNRAFQKKSSDTITESMSAMDVWKLVEEAKEKRKMEEVVISIE